MIVHEFPQLSPEWWAARRGIPSASQFHRILTAKTGKLAAAHEGYLHELIGDRFDLLYPRKNEAVSAGMRHGLEYEPESRRWFEFETGQDVRQVGLCVTDCGRFCCSPDGLVGEASGLELKNPAPSTHVRYLMDGGLPDEYRAQVHGSMIVTGRTSWWFVSYCPGLQPIRLLVLRDEFTERLEAALEEFHARLSAALARFAESP